MVIWLWYENIKSLPIIEPRFPGCFQASRDQGLDQGPPQADVLILPSPETSSWSSQAPPAWAWTWRCWSGQWCWSATCSPIPAWTSSPLGLCSHSPLLNQGEKKMVVHRHMLYFWNPNDSLISNMMMIPTPSPSCSYWSPFFGHRINSRGPSVSPFSWFSRYELSGTDLPYSKGFRKFGCPELSKKSLTLIQLFFVGGAFDPDPDADPYEILVSPPNYFFFFSKTRSLYGVYFQTQNWEKSSFLNVRIYTNTWQGSFSTSLLPPYHNMQR